jgi:integration host factor subunit alpha
MAYVKKHLVAYVQAQLGITKSASQQIVERVLAIMKEALSKKEDILITGFGKFSVKRTRTGRGMDPPIKEGLLMPVREEVVFKVSKSLRQRMNRTEGGGPAAG